MLTKETAKGNVGLISTICRNFEFYQNDTKIRRKLAYEMYSCVELLGLRPPDPLTRGSAPGPRWGHSPQTPIIGSRYRARHSRPQMLKPNSAYGSIHHLPFTAHFVSTYTASHNCRTPSAKWQNVGKCGLIFVLFHC